MTFPIELCIMFGVSILCSSIGLYKQKYFMSVGYGFSIAGCGVILLMLFFDDIDWVSRVLCILLIVFGCRLSAFLLLRSKGNSTYSRHMKEATANSPRAGFETEADAGSGDMGIKLILWFGCAALYAIMVSPICYRLVNKDAILNGEMIDKCAVAGAVLMALGILLEASADFSKGRQKKKYPGEVCRRGLYRFVRCPNYFGEILLWTGVFLTGVTTLGTPGQWIVAIIGYLSIMTVMLSAARHLEKRQNRTYGRDPRYQRYVRKVPLIIPLLPLYSMDKNKDLP